MTTAPKYTPSSYFFTDAGAITQRKEEYVLTAGNVTMERYSTTVNKRLHKFTGVPPKGQ